MNSIKSRLVGNVVANIFAQGVTVLIQLVSVPLFLANWPKEHYGEWLIVSSIPTYLTLVEAGFATASANEVSMFIAEGALAKARRSLHSVWGFLLGVSLCASLVLVPLSFLPPWSALLNVTASVELPWVIFTLGLYSVLGLASSIFSVIYRADYAAPRFGVLTGVGRLLELGGIAICIAQSRSMLHLATVLLLIRVGVCGFMFADGWRRSPQARLGLSDFSLEEIKRIWKPSTMFLAGALGNSLYYQGLTLLVGALLGPGAVVVFNATRTVTRAIAQFATTIRHSAWPEFSYLFGARDLVRARHLTEFATEVVGAGSLALCLVLYLAAPWFMTWWTHGAVQADPQLLAVLLFGAFLNGLGSVISVPLVAANRHQQIAALYLLGSSISLLAGYGLISLLHLPGVAWAMVLCEAISLPYTLHSACRVLEYSVADLCAGVFRFRRSWGECIRLLRHRPRF
jgi:O-antigen/teichoic acid export membrane protein